MLFTCIPKTRLSLRSRFTVLCTFVIFLTGLLQGCVTTPTKTEEFNQTRESAEPADIKPRGIRTIAVVPSVIQPATDIEGMLGKDASTAEGVVLGAAGGVAVGFGIYMLVSASCLFTAGGCVALAPLIAGGALVGGVMGEELESPYDLHGVPATSAVFALDIQTTLVLLFREAAERETNYRFLDSDFESLAVGDADALVEVGLSTIQMDEEEHLRLRGQVRLLTLPGGEVEDTHDFEFVFLESRSPTNWIANSGKAVGDALARSLAPMGYRLAEELFVLHPGTITAHPHRVESAEGQPELTWHLQYSSSRHHWLRRIPSSSPLRKRRWRTFA